MLILGPKISILRGVGRINRTQRSQKRSILPQNAACMNSRWDIFSGRLVWNATAASPSISMISPSPWHNCEMVSIKAFVESDQTEALPTLLLTAVHYRHRYTCKQQQETTSIKMHLNLKARFDTLSLFFFYTSRRIVVLTRRSWFTIKTSVGLKSLLCDWPKTFQGQGSWG